MYILLSKILCCVFFVCLRFFLPTRKFSLTWRRCHCRWRAANFCPMLGTRGHWAVKVLWRATPAVTRGIRLLWSSPRTRDTQTYCRALGSGAVTTCFYDLGQSNALANALVYCATAAVFKNINQLWNTIRVRRVVIIYIVLWLLNKNRIVANLLFWYIYSEFDYWMLFRILISKWGVYLLNIFNMQCICF